MPKAIRRHRQFEKNFHKRIAPDVKLLAQFDERVQMFIAGVRETLLNDHSLTGQLSDYRAFSITGDVHVVYLETKTDIILA